MAIELSATAKILLSKRTLQPNIIFEIDGVENIYGAIEIFKIIHFDDPGLYFDRPGLVFDGSYQDPNAKPYISLSASGNSISQQLLQDKGGTQSITSFTIELIDKNQEITRLITPGLVIDDILGKRCKCYLNYSGGIHPQDSIIFHKGIISNVDSGAASVNFTIDASERIKHQDIFIKGTAKTVGSTTNSATTINVDSTANFLLSADSGTLLTYIQIEDEIIQYTGKTSTSFTGCVRGLFGTTAIAHSAGQDANSIYALSGNAIDLALKIMLSGPNAFFAEDISVSQYGATLPMTAQSNAIAFGIEDVQNFYGLVIGDKFTTSGSINPSNDVSDALIIGFGKNDFGSWILTDQTFTLEYNSTALISLKSKYNVLSDGLSMIPDDVDVERHEDLRTKFATTVADYVFYLKDTIQGSEFLNTQIYYPSGFYSLPRKTRSSLGITVPPIADQEIVLLDENTVVSASTIKSKRSINKNFYNATLFAYNKNIIDDKYKTGVISYSADSRNRINTIGNKPLNIQSDGLRSSGSTNTLTRIVGRRLLERYQFGAELYSGVKLLGKAGINLEVGDVTVFGSDALNMSDTITGSRNYIPRLFEVVNKNLSVKEQAVTVDLLATNFQIDGRYGVISPASYVDTGSTTTRIKIRDSFSTQSPRIEKDKWPNYIGETITVRSLDYAFSENVTLVSFDPSDDYAMLVTPALSAAPSSGYVVDAPNYDSGTDPRVQAIWKLMHCFFDPQIPVTSGTSQTVFDVGAGDVGKIFVGSILRIHNFNFSVDSPEVIVNDITGTTITVNIPLGFIPSTSEVLDLVGFNDHGLPYRAL